MNNCDKIMTAIVAAFDCNFAQYRELQQNHKLNCGRTCLQFLQYQVSQQPIPESPSQPWNVHGLTLKGKMDENWFQLLAPFISQWNNRAEFRVDVYARQEGLLSFNSDYMVWYRRKTKMFIDPNNANTATLVFISF